MSSNDEILCRLENRLDALTAQVAKLAAAVSARPVTKVATPAALPKRLTTQQAAAQLNIDRTTLHRYATRGLCSEIRPAGRGRNCRVYYLPDEIEALAISEETARELMSRKRLQKRPSR